jgi:hypothetical protein
VSLFVISLLVRQRTLQEFDVGQAFQPDGLPQLDTDWANLVSLERLTYKGAL